MPENMPGNTQDAIAWLVNLSEGQWALARLGAITVLIPAAVILFLLWLGLTMKRR